MEASLITIVIPVYKTEKTLARCIDSALAQTYKNCEVVIVDDGTPDSAGVIADDYAVRHENVKVVHKQNAGLAEARRSGVKVANGEYIIHLDSDDELLPDAVEFLLSKCNEMALDIAYGNYIRINGKGQKSEICFPSDLTILSGEEFLKYNITPVGICASWGCLAKRGLWLNDDIYPPSNTKLPSEDLLINIKISRYVERVGFFNHPVCCYYYNSQSLSITGVLSQLDKWKEYYSIVEKELISRGLFENNESNLLSMKIFHLSFCMNNLDTSDPWVKNIIEDKRFKLPPKYRLIQFLIQYPRLWEFLRDTKRRIFN
ncbi:MAG: glycosyltransferase [Muribaculaceae bacterium]|nr:glycosyltransferase [Muribaculaceae bacterium]